MITEVKLSAFVYRLFHKDFSVGENLHETVCKEMQTNYNFCNRSA